MNAHSSRLGTATLALCLVFFARVGSSAVASGDFDQRLKSFAIEKETQARTLAAEHKVEVAPEVWTFFKTAKSGDWKSVTNQFRALMKRAAQYDGSKADPSVTSPVWSTVLEVDLGAEQLLEFGPRLTSLLVNDLTGGITNGAIYFGGTDPGRGLPTVASASHLRGDPFFTLTQNALADANYLKYVQSTYGKLLKMLSEENSAAAFTAYVEDTRKRLDHDTQFPNDPKQIKPGEDVRYDPQSGRIMVSGQVAVMTINGLLAKMIFERNPSREFYVEESFPLDWMYPHLTPHGAILKLNREPVARLSVETIAADHAYWSERVKSFLGADFAPPNTVKDVCEFVERVHVRRDLAGFKGDLQFLRNPAAQAAYSKLRSAAAGVYFWRINESGRNGDMPDQKRMLAESDRGFLQAFALCPTSPEAVFRYTNLLISLQRIDAAMLIAETAEKLDTGNKTFQALKKQLEQLKARSPSKK
ncbi:MAG: hypothetical protein ABMA26_09265 [Limisphaerales bacterium]